MQMMNRRDFIRHAAAGLSLFSVASCVRQDILSPDATWRRPNVVFILTDDLGLNDVGCYSDDARVKTPNIDRLAQHGMKFTNAHAPASICTPSRFALLTGKYCWRTSLKSGVIAHTPLLIEPGSTTLPSVFKESGYATACIGKWHLGTRLNERGTFDPKTHFVPPVTPGPNDIGFDYFFGLPVGHFYPPYVYLENHDIYNYEASDPLELMKSPEAGIRGYVQKGANKARYNHEDVLGELTERAVNYIAENKDKRFFLYFATSSPHEPYTPSEKFKGKSQLGDYGDFMMETDWAVGQVINAINANGLEDDTLVIFSSDNGGENSTFPAFSDYNYKPNGKWRGDKGDIYEGGLRIPFIAFWPKVIKEGSTSDQLLGFNDMLATFSALLAKKLDESAAVDSVNMLDAFWGKQSLNPERGLVLHSRAGMFALIKDDWKYIHGQGNGQFVKGGYPTPDQPTRGQLFNLAKDPYETVDVIDKHPAIAEGLQKLLRTYYTSGHTDKNG